MDLILLQPGNKTIFGSNDFNGSIDAGPGGLDDPIAGQLGHCIELVSVHQGLKQQVTTDVSNSARTSGRPIITEFTCVKYVDRTSAKFYELCLRAEPLGKGKDQPTRIHILRNSGDKTANVISFHLRDALISEVQLQSHPDDMPTEQFKLNFTEILWECTAQNADGSRAVTELSGWSLARNRPIGSFTD